MPGMDYMKHAAMEHTTRIGALTQMKDGTQVPVPETDIVAADAKFNKHSSTIPCLMNFAPTIFAPTASPIA